MAYFVLEFFNPLNFMIQSAFLKTFNIETLLHIPPMYFKPRILEDLVEILSCSPIPITYAGGVRCLKDLELIDMLGRGRVHATIGSALGKI